MKLQHFFSKFYYELSLKSSKKDNTKQDKRTSNYILKKIICVFICVVLIAGVWGCKSNNSDDDNNRSDVVNTGGDGTEGEISETDLEDTENEGEDPISADLGATTFSIEETSKASREFVPGEDLSLELADGAGLTWCLTIPGDALLNAENITMTALSDVKNDELGQLEGGVLLEPDGLSFLNPATLKVSGNGIEEDGIILTGSHDGTETEFSNTSYEEGGMSSNLFHFSSAYGNQIPGYGPGESRKRLQQIAEQRMSLLILEIHELLASPIDVPEPPSIPLVCRDNPNESEERQALYKFANTFMDPERDMLQRLLDAESFYMLAFHTQQNNTQGNNSEGNNSQGNSSEGSNTQGDTSLVDPKYSSNEIDQFKSDLILRLGNKLNRLLEKYIDRPDKYLAVCKAYETFRMHVDIFYPNYKEDYDAKLRKWKDKIIDDYIKAVREEHDYKALSGALYLIDRDNIDYYRDKIRKALTFKVGFENNVTVEEGAFKVEGEALVTFPDGEALDGFILRGSAGTFEGKGVGNYTQFKTFNKDVQLKMPNSFSFSPVVTDYRPCKSDGLNIYIDFFGAEQEVYMANGGSMPTLGIVHGSTGLLFNEHLAKDEMMKQQLKRMHYKFPMDLKNKSEVASDKTFTKSLNGIKISYNLKLVHAPQ